MHETRMIEAKGHFRIVFRAADAIPIVLPDN